MARRFLQLIPLLALTIAVAIGVFVVFFRTYRFCFRPGNAVFCRDTTLWVQQPIGDSQSTYLLVIVWSVAPLLSYVGVRLWLKRGAGLGLACLILGLVIEVSSLTRQFGRYYATLVAPLIFLTLLGLPLVRGKSRMRG